MFATRHLNTDNQKRVKRIVKDEEDTLANIEQEVDMSLIEIAYNGCAFAKQRVAQRRCLAKSNTYAKAQPFGKRILPNGWVYEKVCLDKLSNYHNCR
jgi:hypothetical protein